MESDLIKIFLLQLLFTTSYSAEMKTIADYETDRDNMKNEFTSILNKFVDNYLGVGSMQAHYNSLQFEETLLDGATIIQELSAALKTKLSERFQAVLNLTAAIKVPLQRNTYKPKECCKVTDTSFEHDERFNRRVDPRNFCDVLSSETDKYNYQKMSNTVLEQMKHNFGVWPTLKWQYFGSEDGALSLFPSYHWENCDGYDPRYRPWYVAASTPKPKDVVIIIDTSGSMRERHGSRTLMEIAIEAGLTVVGTLNPLDRIGVVAFSDNARVPQGSFDSGNCYSEILANATPQNTNYLQSFIKTLQPGGSTYYAKGLREAFRLLSNSKKIHVASRERVILFLTDGIPTDTEVTIRQTLQEQWDREEDKFKVLTFGLGRNVVSQGGNILRSMAEGTGGHFTPVEDPSKLRKAMGSYYNLFAVLSENTAPIVSVPYFDHFGLGLITTVAMPVVISGALMGVVGIDVTMADLLADVTYFRDGSDSYAFIMDSRGRAVMHPLLPRPSDVDEDPIFVDMRLLERENEFLSVYNSMLSGGSGSKSMRSDRVVSKGNSATDGVTIMSVNTVYHWMPVGIGGFSIGVAIANNDKKVDLRNQRPSANAFKYHRIDMDASAESKCQSHNRIILENESVVKLAPVAFEDPYGYINREETEAVIKDYTNYMTDDSGLYHNPGFVEGVRDDNAVTYKAEEIWKSVPSNSTFNVIWRYIGTQKGVRRIFPGVVSHKLYSNLERPWYLRALANKGMITFSTPYEDASGAGYVITISHTVSKKSGDNVAVMGMDFTMSYINYLINAEEFCKNAYDNVQIGCFLIDTSGYLVMHPDFVQTDCSEIQTTRVSNVHITEKSSLSAFAAHLIDNGIMTRRACINFKSVHYQHFWEIDTKASRLNLTPSSCLKYELHYIPNTNVFLVISKQAEDCSLTSLPKCKECRSNKRCYTPVDLDSCECPCTLPADYGYCQDEFHLLLDDWPTCTPPQKSHRVVLSEQEHQLQQLPQCDSTLKCDLQTTESDCYKHSCVWLEQCSKCIKPEECSAGTENCDEGVSTGAVVGIVIAIIMTIVIILLIVSCRKRKNQLATSQTTSLSLPANNPHTSRPQNTSYSNTAFVDETSRSPSAPSTEPHSSRVYGGSENTTPTAPPVFAPHRPPGTNSYKSYYEAPQPDELPPPYTVTDSSYF